MASASRQHVLTATRQWLRPLVNVLIRSGITWREFADLAKSSYVEVATTEFGKRGRPTNVSRTAVLTGLARREVRRQRERIEEGPEQPGGYVTKGSLVLSAWHLDPEFLDAAGNPAILPLEGEGPTFAALLKRCGAGDVRASTLLKELRSAGAIRETADGRVEALQRSYIPHKIDSEFIRLWGARLADIGTTSLHNLTRTGRSSTRFERAAVNDRISASALPEFQEFLNQEGQAFLERLDAWLAAHELTDGDPALSDAKGKGKSGKGAAGTGTIRLGAGVYHIQD